MRRWSARLAFVYLPLFVYLLLWGSSLLRAQGCPYQPHFSNDARRYTGAYRNGAYGFATVIPKGLTGLDENDPLYQRGFSIPLPDAAGQISVFAEANSAGFADPRAAARTQVRYLHGRAVQVSAPTYSELQLATRPAVRVTSEFHCAGDRTAYELISVLALDAGRRFVYTLSWEGSLAKAQTAGQTMGALVSSWRFLTPR